MTNNLTEINIGLIISYIDFEMTTYIFNVLVF